MMTDDEWSIISLLRQVALSTGGVATKWRKYLRSGFRSPVSRRDGHPQSGAARIRFWYHRGSDIELTPRYGFALNFYALSARKLL
jgi:hypothetical protein